MKMNNYCIKLKVILAYLIFVSVVSSSGLRSVYGFLVNKTGTNAEIKWDITNVNYYINKSGGPANSLAALQAALQTWTSVPAAKLSFIFGGETTSTAYGINDGKNMVCFGPISTTGTLAQNKFWYYTNSGKLVDSDIKFNTNYTWGTDGTSGKFDVQNIATHELGHSLSLADLYAGSDSDKTMYGYAAMGETKKRDLDQDDINGIAYLYPDTADADGDGILNYADNCPLNCNTQQLDADEDGAGDVCDTEPGCGGCSGIACEQGC
jgi:hypothetical protein